MKKFLILITSFLLFNCVGDFTPMKCGYCKGNITYSKIHSGLILDRNCMEYINFEGESYHPWCLKIKLLEESFKQNTIDQNIGYNSARKINKYGAVERTK